MVKKVMKILATVGSGLLIPGYLFVWTVIFFVTGILMFVDWIHWIWTGDRIYWIQRAMEGWRDLFDHPFTRG